MNAHLRRFGLNGIGMSFAAIVLCGQAVLAQTQQQDAERLRREGVERDDAAARAQGFEMQRQQARDREKQEEERRRSNLQSSPSTGGGTASGYTGPSSGGTGADTGRAFADARASFEKRPPLPASRNRLLGKWQLQRGNTGAQNSLFDMLANPGVITCPVVFGEGVLDFRESVLADDAGNALDQVRYRGDGSNRVAVLGTRGLQLMVFDFEGPNRIRSAFYDCVFARVGAAPAVAARAGAAAETANAAPGASSRAPAGGGIANLGVSFGAAIDAVRQSLAVRRVSVLPARHNGSLYRLVADGDFANIDQRIQRVGYEFDAPEGPSAKLTGVVITYARDGGGAQSAVFGERVAAMSKKFPLAPESPTQWQASVQGTVIRLIDDATANSVYEIYRMR